LARPFYFLWISALIHDIEKPASRVELSSGAVAFPGHEARAALRVPEIAARLGLTAEEEGKLLFLVKEHGEAHAFPALPETKRQRLVASRYWRNLRLLQRADALSCYLNPEGTETLPVHWDDFASANERFASRDREDT
jgi:hypothetical protein